MAEGNNFLRIPKFDGDYDHWLMLMENLLRSKEYWSIIENGYCDPGAEETPTAAQQKTCGPKAKGFESKKLPVPVN